MLKDKYLQQELHTHKQERQTFNKMNVTEVQSASSVSEGTSEKAMSDCQPKGEKTGNPVKVHVCVCVNLFQIKLRLNIYFIL